MAFSITSTYAGEVLDELITLCTVGNETVSGGHIAVHNRIQKTKTIPRIVASNLIQAQAVTPTSQGTITVDERILNPQDFMVYHEMNPRDFEMFWAEFQSATDLLDRDLSPEVRQAVLGEIARVVNEHLGAAIWQSDIAGGVAPMNFFDGVIRKAELDADVIDASTPVALTVGNVQSKFEQVYDLVPAAVRRKPNFKMFCSDATGELYKKAVHAQTNKGNDFTQGAPLTYSGKEIVSLVGMPDDCIFATYAGANPLTSNIHLGIDWQYNTTTSVVQLEKLQANSELFFAKMLMKADTQIGFGQECVLYKA